MTIQRAAVLRVVRRLHESPDAKERAIAAEQKIAENDDSVRSFVEMFHFDADREVAFQRFSASDFAADVILAVRHHYGDRKDVAICEIGAGNGFLAAALVRAGYTDVDILEPSAGFATGTGFIQSKPEFERVKVYNELDEWYASEKLYDLVITNACIHHFDNPTVVGAQIRLKLKDGAYWLAFTEFFASDYEDTLTQLSNHRHAVLYGLYEWPYSAKLYSAMMSASGFKLKELAPLNPYGRVQLDGKGAVLRRVWRLSCAIGISRLAYFLWRVIAKSRHRPRAADASYMMFVARPIRWNIIDKGYTEFEAEIQGHAPRG